MLWVKSIVYILNIRRYILKYFLALRLFRRLPPLIKKVFFYGRSSSILFFFEQLLPSTPYMRQQNIFEKQESLGKLSQISMGLERWFLSSNAKDIGILYLIFIIFRFIRNSIFCTYKNRIIWTRCSIYSW